MDKLFKIKDKDKELYYIQIQDYIKVNGKIILKMEKAIKFLPIIPYIMALILKENQMDMENINGKMDKSTKVNGSMVLKKDLVFGEEVKEIHILGNGKMVEQMVMEYIHGLMEIDIKENFYNVLNMVKE
jgi:hypothetical protein